RSAAAGVSCAPLQVRLHASRPAGEGRAMPLFIDRHDIEGVTAQAVMEAHALDMAVQDKHGVNYLTYWVDEARGRVFCLCDAPTKELAEQVHREAHGLLANKIMEGDPDTVEAWIGRAHA